MSPTSPARRKTHCVHGHLRTPENITASGACRTCKRIARKAYKKTPKGRASHLRYLIVYLENQLAWVRNELATLEAGGL